MNGEIEVHQESGQRVSKNGREPHLQSKAAAPESLVALGSVASAPGSWNLPFFLIVTCHQASVLPAGKGRTERTGRGRGEDPPPGRLVIVSTQWSADTLHEITATP